MMDTQLSIEEGSDGEWAVERIRSHAESKTDAVFEVQWTSGDVTWLPYYQITHLQALTDYFDLLGISQVSQLPKGHGMPPPDDPQIFLGSITPLSSVNSSFFSIPHLFTHYLSSFFSSMRSIRLSLLLPPEPFISPTVDLHFEGPMPPPRGVNHPSFTRVSSTHYRLKEPNRSYSTMLHVGQIADYLKFDEKIRRRGGTDALTTMPFGFVEFARIWNDGVPETDQRRLCKLTIAAAGQPDHLVELPTTNVDVSDFFIRPEQIGLASDTSQDVYMRAFASIMIKKQESERRGYEERQEKKTYALTGTSPSHRDSDASRSTSPVRRLKFKKRRIASSDDHVPSASTSGSVTAVSSENSMVTHD